MKKLNRDERFTIGGTLYIMILMGINSQLIGTVVPHMRAEYGFSYEMSGYLMSANAAGTLVMSLIASYTAIFFGFKKAFCVQHALIIVGQVVVSVTGNPILLLAGMALLGLGRGSTVNYSYQIVNDTSNSNAGVMGLANAFFAVGACIVPFLVLVCVNGLGNWRYASLGIAAATAIGIALSMRMKIGEADSKSSEEKRGGYAFFKLKEYWLLLVIVFFYLGSEVCVGGWVITHFMDTHEASNQLASSMVTVFWATMLVGRLISSFLANRMKESSLMLFMSIGMVVFAALFVGVGSTGFAVAATIGLGLFMSGFYGLALASGGHIFSEYKVALGFVMTVGGIGAVTMPALVGIIAERHSIQVGLVVLAVNVTALMVLTVFNARLAKKH